MTDTVRCLAEESSLLICDDRAPVRQALALRLASTRDPGLVRAVADGPALTEAFTARPADLVLIGVHPAAPAAAGEIGVLLDRHPTAVVIGYGAAQDSDLLTTAIAHGARGVMLWNPFVDRPGPSLPALGLASSTDADRSAGYLPLLTEREQQVLHAMSSGRSNQEIGRHLFLSEDTVKTHARRLYSKLGANDRAHAVAIGIRRGLLRLPVSTNA